MQAHAASNAAVMFPARMRKRHACATHDLGSHSRMDHLRVSKCRHEAIKGAPCLQVVCQESGGGTCLAPEAPFGGEEPAHLWPCRAALWPSSNGMLAAHSKLLGNSPVLNMPPPKPAWEIRSLNGTYRKETVPPILLLEDLAHKEERGQGSIISCM